ncbi:MAG: uL15 family ribosomal protein [Candidatus Aenigmarchaeota archaeon]|nr:uL15 family ribosomal protein [Candidatus Aenigmarchaeota archaeon]
MAKKRKKVIKMRGQKKHGYGSKKKHRGKGSRGGRGFAGKFKHKKIMFKKYFPERYIKKRFKSLQEKGIRKYGKPINLRDIQTIIERENLKENQELNLTEMGYDKVIGAGELKTAAVIKAALFSAGAKAKIEKAGGKFVETGS